MHSWNVVVQWAKNIFQLHKAQLPGKVSNGQLSLLCQLNLSLIINALERPNFQISKSCAASSLLKCCMSSHDLKGGVSSPCHCSLCKTSGDVQKGLGQSLHLTEKELKHQGQHDVFKPSGSLKARRYNGNLNLYKNCYSLVCCTQVQSWLLSYSAALVSSHHSGQLSHP